ncbi:MAG: hypothetical protein JWR60_1881 [Polaromonas sp.]|nr:hypothetical protein [Polaromonas sp.]
MARLGTAVESVKKLTPAAKQVQIQIQVRNIDDATNSIAGSAGNTCTKGLLDAKQATASWHLSPFGFGEAPIPAFPQRAKEQHPNRNRNPNPHPTPRPQSRSAWACDDPKKRDQGGALFECSAAERVCADPCFFGAAQVARSAAKGPRQPGRLSFAYFSLAKQRKVSCRRATPGQQATAEKTEAISKHQSKARQGKKPHPLRFQ